MEPVSPSSLIKVSRWSLLALGFMYGSTRYSWLKKKEDELRRKEEEERPAKEAAMKAERERKNREEMAYLAQQAGVTNKGSGGDRDGNFGGGGDTGKREYRSECGCRY